MRSSKAEALADCLLEQQRPLLTTRALTVDSATAVILISLFLFLQQDS